MTTTVYFTDNEIKAVSLNSPMLKALLNFPKKANSPNYRISVPISITNNTWNKILLVLQGTPTILIATEWLSSFIIIRYLMPSYNPIWCFFWKLVESTHLSRIIIPTTPNTLEEALTNRYSLDDLYLYLMCILHDSSYTLASNIISSNAFYPILKRNKLNTSNLIDGLIELLNNDINLLGSDIELFLTSLSYCFPDIVINIKSPMYKIISSDSLDLDIIDDNLITNIEKLSGHYWILDIIKNNNNLIIAGGCIINGLFNLKFKPYSNIDIWVLGNSVEIRCNAWFITIRNIWDKCPKPTIISVKDNVATLIPPYPYIAIQIILTGYSNPDLIIQNFDMDYLKCLVGCNTGIRASLSALVSWINNEARPSRHISHSISLIRIAKTLEKGFQPVDCGLSDITKVFQEVTWKKEQQRYLKETFKESELDRIKWIVGLIYQSDYVYLNPDTHISSGIIPNNPIKNNKAPTYFNHVFYKTDGIRLLTDPNQQLIMQPITSNLPYTLYLKESFSNIINDSFHNELLTLSISPKIAFRLPPLYLFTIYDGILENYGNQLILNLDGERAWDQPSTHILPSKLHRTGLYEYFNEIYHNLVKAMQTFIEKHKSTIPMLNSLDVHQIPGFRPDRRDPLAGTNLDLYINPTLEIIENASTVKISNIFYYFLNKNYFMEVTVLLEDIVIKNHKIYPIWNIIDAEIFSDVKQNATVITNLT